jgi:hypothetical protein
LYEVGGAGPFSVHVLQKVALVRHDSQWVTLRQALLQSGVVALQPSPTTSQFGANSTLSSEFDRSVLQESGSSHAETPISDKQHATAPLSGLHGAPAQFHSTAQFSAASNSPPTQQQQQQQQLRQQQTSFGSSQNQSGFSSGSSSQLPQFQLNMSKTADRLLEQQNQQLEQQLLSTRLVLDEVQANVDAKNDNLRAMASELDRERARGAHLEREVQGERRNHGMQAARLEGVAAQKVSAAKKETRADGASREASLCDKIDEMQYFADLQAVDFRDQKDKLVEAEVNARLKRAEAEWAKRMHGFQTQKDKEIAALHTRISELLSSSSRSAQQQQQIQPLHDNIARLQGELIQTNAARTAAEKETVEARRLADEMRTRPDRSKLILEQTITELQIEIQRMQAQANEAAREANAQLQRELETVRTSFEHQLQESWNEKERVESQLHDEIDQLRAQMAADFEQKLAREQKRAALAEEQLLNVQRELARKAPDSEITALQQQLQAAEAALLKQTALAREAQTKALQANTAEHERRLKEQRANLEAARTRGDTMRDELEARLNKDFERERQQLQADADEKLRAAKLEFTNLQRELDRQQQTADDRRRETVNELQDQTALLAEAEAKRNAHLLDRRNAEMLHQAEIAKHQETGRALEDAHAAVQRQASELVAAETAARVQEEELAREKAQIARAKDDELHRLKQHFGGTEEDLRRAMADLERRAASTVEQLLAAERREEDMRREQDRILDIKATEAAAQLESLRLEFARKLAARDEQFAQDEHALREQQRTRLKDLEDHGSGRDEVLRAEIKSWKDEIEQLRRQHAADVEAARLTAADARKEHDLSVAELKNAARAQREEMQRRLREREDEGDETERSLKKEAASRARELQANVEDRQRQLGDKITELNRVKQENKEQVEAMRAHGADALHAAQSKLQAQLIEMNANAAKEVEDAMHRAEEYKLKSTTEQSGLEHKLKLKQAEIDTLTTDLIAANLAHTNQREEGGTAMQRIEELQAEVQAVRVRHMAELDETRRAHELSAVEANRQHDNQVTQLQASLEAVNDLMEEQATEIDRLNRRILELEARIAELEAENKMHVEHIAHMEEHAESHEDLVWRAAEAASRLAEEQAAQDATQPFRTDLCNWINGLCQPNERSAPLAQKTMIRQLADGVLLCKLACIIDKEEVALRRVDELENKAAWSKKDQFKEADAKQAKEDTARAGRRRRSGTFAGTSQSSIDRMLAGEEVDAIESDGQRTPPSMSPRRSPSQASQGEESDEGGSPRRRHSSFSDGRGGSSSGIRPPQRRSSFTSSVSSTGREGRGKSLAVLAIPGMAYIPPDACHSSMKRSMATRVIASPVYRQGIAGSQAARLNIIAFLDWAQGLGLAKPGAFEVDDLFMYQNQKAVIFGLFDVARRCRTRVPKFVSFERALHRPRTRTNVSQDDPVDIAVADIIEDCSCSPRLELTRIAPMKYMMANEKKPLLMSCPVPGQVLCRVGGGYEPLRTFLDKRDKCRRDKHAIFIKQCFANLMERLRRDAEVGTIDNTHIAIFTNRPLSANSSPVRSESRGSGTGSGHTTPRHSSSPLRPKKVKSSGMGSN